MYGGCVLLDRVLLNEKILWFIHFLARIINYNEVYKVPLRRNLSNSLFLHFLNL